MNIDPSIFKAYDIRGIYPEQINAEVVYRIAQAYAKLLNLDSSSQIVLGHDMRLSGQEFSEVVIKGLTDAGVNVIDIGLCSTDQMYFATATLPVNGGIQITASHNPKEFGGMKMVREKGHPISGDTGIYEIRDLVISAQCSVLGAQKGTVVKKDISDDYFHHVLSFFDIKKFKPFKIVANTNFGMATVAVEKLKTLLPVEFVKVLHGKLDGTFPLPNGRPDPLVPENRDESMVAIKELKPDLGVAWDADADRCFFFDETGKFVTAPYINALLAEYYLQKYPGAKIVHDTRVVRVIDFVVKENGGTSIATKAGHSFMKERMIAEDAVFGNETSGHYYFKDNFYLDNGLIPFLAVLEILSTELQKTTEGNKKTFSQLLAPLREKFYISEEINFKFENQNILEDLRQKYADAQIDDIDGYSFNYPNWRFNARKSNTENLLRINVEADSQGLLDEKIKEISELIEKIK